MLLLLIYFKPLSVIYVSNDKDKTVVSRSPIRGYVIDVDRKLNKR